MTHACKVFLLQTTALISVRVQAVLWPAVVWLQQFSDCALRRQKGEKNAVVCFTSQPPYSARRSTACRLLERYRSQIDAEGTLSSQCRAVSAKLSEVERGLLSRYMDLRCAGLEVAVRSYLHDDGMQWGALPGPCTGERLVPSLSRASM